MLCYDQDPFPELIYITCAVYTVLYYRSGCPILVDQFWRFAVPRVGVILAYHHEIGPSSSSLLLYRVVLA